MNETSYNSTFGGHENYAFRRTARYRDGSGRFAYAPTYRPGSVTTDVKKQVPDSARRFAARHPGGTDDRQPTKPRAASSGRISCTARVMVDQSTWQKTGSAACGSWNRKMTRVAVTR